MRTSEDPDKAKVMGQCPDGFRKDWGAVKDSLMEKAILAKFTQHPDLQEKLLETGEAPLVEHTEEDSYWGDGGDGGSGENGKNMLGKILVKVREYIKQVENSKL